MGDITEGPCPCHHTMDNAIRGHEQLVYEQARRLSSPDRSEWDDLVSDGMLALWQVLEGFDPERRNLQAVLRIRIRHRMIDALRRRSGRGADTPVLLSLDEDDLPEVEVDHGAAVEFADMVRALAPLDPRLPGLAALLVCGYTIEELGAMRGLTRQRASQLLHLAQRHDDAA